MATSDFMKNLTLVTGYGRSVSDVCRRAGINRQQYNRYLSGQSSPSLSTLRRICDFFGLEDHEIFLDHQSFANIVRRRPPRLKQDEDSITRFVRDITQQHPNQSEAMAKYEGYFFSYSQVDDNPQKLLRSLISIQNSGLGWVSTTVERYSNSTYTIPDKMKYRGVVFINANRLILLEQETRFRNSTWTTMMYTTDFDDPNVLSGLTMGIAPESSHEIVCFRTVWDFQGKNPNLRKAIKACGLLNMGDPSIPDYISRYIDDTPVSGSNVLTPRY